MDQGATKMRFNWRSSLGVAVGTVLFFFATLFVDEDLSLALYAIGVVLVSFFLLILVIAGKGRRLSSLSMLLACWVISAILLVRYGAHRDAMRWAVLSPHYKTKVLTQPRLPNGELPHVEWDGWGMFGMDTTVYLVYDPGDALSVDVNHPGKFHGIPCEVYSVRRLERYWYSVQFYTDTVWGRCQ